MSVKIYSSTKIYIACPANVATGGPELLHQLAYHFINDLNVEAFIYYYNFNSKKFKTPVHPEYQIYNVPYVLEIGEDEDIEKNILIVTEVQNALFLLQRFRHIRKGVWFLSVDGYYYSKLTKKDFFIPRAINKIIKKIFKKPLIDFDITSQEVLNKLVVKHDYRKDSLLKLASFYMTNTYRGLKWFSDLTPLYYLSEYINEFFLKTQTDLSQKKDIVAYNPKKGFSFTKKIIRYAPEIKFVPIINMTRQQVIKTLQKAKVYIDFGNHPGKDRLPREAAILGCCVITGKRGSAKYFEDVSIPEEYKFEDTKENINKIIQKIRFCFKNYKKAVEDFDYYRNVIKREKEKFLQDIKKIFKIKNE